MRRAASGELARVVAEDGFDRHAEGVVEAQDPIVEQVMGRGILSP